MNYIIFTVDCKLHYGLNDQGVYTIQYNLLFDILEAKNWVYFSVCH